MAGSQLAGSPQKFGGGHDDSHVSHDRLENHGGYLAAALGERSLQAARVVVIEHERVMRRAPRHARRIRHAERRRRAAGGHQQAIHMAVVIAREFDHDIAPREPAGQTQSAHRGFSSRIHQPHLLDRRHGRDDQVGQFTLGLGRRSEARPAGNRRLERRGHGWMAMPEDHRSPGADVIDVAIAVEIEEIRPAAPLEKNRFPADSAKSSSGTIHAAGHQLPGAGESAMALFAIYHCKAVIESNRLLNDLETTSTI